MPKEKKEILSRADQLTMQMRIRTVMQWILQGYITKDIISYADAQWGVDERMVYKYINACKKQFKDSRKGKISERIDFYLAAKLKLYNEMKDKTSPRGARAANNILDSMARLEGAITDKIDITSKGKELKAQTEGKVFKTTLKLD